MRCSFVGEDVSDRFTTSDRHRTDRRFKKLVESSSAMRSFRPLELAPDIANDEPAGLAFAGDHKELVISEDFFGRLVADGCRAPHMRRQTAGNRFAIGTPDHRGRRM